MTKSEKESWANKTVDEARQHLRKNWKEGTTCVCCGQKVMLYHRSLTSAMAMALHLFSKAQTDIEGYVHAENFFKTQNCPSSIRGDFPKLRFWGFIMAKPSDSEGDTSSSGMYKILPKGIEFLKGELIVPAAVLIYNNKFIGFSENTTNFNGALKNKFKIEDLKVA
jgi:hypothetical protein